jgi:N utilization substance protein A
MFILSRGFVMAEQFNILQALEQIYEEKGISKKIIIEAIEAALYSAFKKDYDPDEEISVKVCEADGTIKLFKKFTVVKKKTEVDKNSIILSQARKYVEKAEAGDIVDIEIKTENLGRIAAQTAKQVVIQRIREAEREMLFHKFQDKIGTIIAGEVQRVKRGEIHLLFGRMEAILRARDQIGEKEHFNIHDRVKVYVRDINRNTKGPMLQVSRSCPEFVEGLFKEEIPEINDKILEIKGVSREAGQRTKIAVYSDDTDIDCIGACVGIKGQRIQSIIDELRGEKIDIIKWDEDLRVFITNALSPATVLDIKLKKENTEALVVVPDNQQSLAIGRRGQNVRLAARLVGCKLDIKSESEYEKAGEEIEECTLAVDDQFMGEFFDDLPEENKKASDSAVVTADDSDEENKDS